MLLQYLDGEACKTMGVIVDYTILAANRKVCKQFPAIGLRRGKCDIHPGVPLYEYHTGAA
jgi:hypothetical protein